MQAAPDAQWTRALTGEGLPADPVWVGGRCGGLGYSDEWEPSVPARWAWHRSLQVPTRWQTWGLEPRLHLSVTTSRSYGRGRWNAHAHAHLSFGRVQLRPEGWHCPVSSLRAARRWAAQLPVQEHLPALLALGFAPAECVYQLGDDGALVPHLTVLAFVQGLDVGRQTQPGRYLVVSRGGCRLLEQHSSCTCTSSSPELRERYPAKDLWWAGAQ